MNQKQRVLTLNLDNIFTNCSITIPISAIFMNPKIAQNYYILVSIQLVIQIIKRFFLIKICTDITHNVIFQLYTPLVQLCVHKFFMINFVKHVMHKFMRFVVSSKILKFCHAIFKKNFFSNVRMRCHKQF